jgi:adenosylmethionine-8-amino-7-oxononanoate aminotransferase
MVLRHLDSTPTPGESGASSVAPRQPDSTPKGNVIAGTGAAKKSAVLHRDLSYDFLPLVEGNGNHLGLADGRRVFDASGGAAVGCIGWGNERVAQAVMRQMLAIPYCSTIFYTTKVQEELCRYLVDSTHGNMGRAYIVNSGQCGGDQCLVSLLTPIRIRGNGGGRQARQAVFPRD